MTESESEAEDTTKEPDFALEGFNSAQSSTYPSAFKQVVEKINYRSSVIHHLHLTIRKMEKAARRRAKQPSFPHTYHNTPAMVEKVATLTSKVAELEKASLLKISSLPHP